MMKSQKLNDNDQVIHMQMCEKLHHRYMKDYLHYLDRGGKDRKVESLIKFVEKELELSQAAYEATSVKSRTSDSGKDGSSASEGKGKPYRRNVNSVNKTKSEMKRSCADCTEDHPVWECPQFQRKGLEDRLQIVRKKGLCFKCLGKNHTKTECYFRGGCDQEGCNGGHHKLLHQSKPNRVMNRNDSRPVASGNSDTQGTKEGNQEEEKAEDSKHVNAISSGTAQVTARTVLNLIPVYVFKNNGKQRIRCLALHDSGSNTTLISETLKRKLGLHGRKETHVYHQPVRNDTVKREVEVIDMVKVESISGDFTLKLKNVETMPGQLQAEAVDWNTLKNKYDYLKDVQFPEINPCEKADLLIGADQSLLFRQLDQRAPIKNGDPIAIETPLGWICMGIIPQYRTVKQVNAILEERLVYHQYRQDEKEVGDILKKFWEVDDIQHQHTKEMSIENHEVLERTRASTSYNGVRYQVAMPFKEDKIDQPTEEFKVEMWKMARKRLESTEASLRAKKGKAEKYQEVINGYLEKGYARITSDPEDTKWLLPHFPVIREDKETTKVRVVFDGSARVQNISLNDQIYEGPKLQQDIFNVLLRFRKYEVAINSDIKEMFPGIEVTPNDSKYLRILWRNMENREPDIIELLRVTFGINASPFLAMCTLLDHSEKYRKTMPRAVEALTKSTYVDDTLDSVKTVDEALKVYQDMTMICQEAGWKIHKWSSNNQDFLKHVPEENKAQGTLLEQSISEGMSVKTLGVKWAPETDVFVGESVVVDMNGKISKRTVLKKIAQIYDPLGMLSPYVMQCKMILQEIWMSGKDWDDPIEGTLRKKILEWFNDLYFADSIRQPRVLLLNSDNIQYVELHCFTDASERAYGAVVYLKVMYEEETLIRWVAAKGRVCPLEPISIPRLELMAATFGAQLTDKVRKALEQENIVTRMWTDSMTALWWIRGRTRDLKLFVANRVLEIHKYTQPSEWRHVPSAQNPAYIISRGCSLLELKESRLWHYGPEFLKEDVQDWPVQTSAKPKEADREVKKQYLDKVVAHIGAYNLSEENDSDVEDDINSQISDYDSSDEETSDMLEQMKRMDHLKVTQEMEKKYIYAIDKDENTQANLKPRLLKVDPDVDYLAANRFSSMNKLVRVRAYVNRFIHNCSVPVEERLEGALHVWELDTSEKEIIVEEQKRKFKIDYKALVNGKKVDNNNSELKDLNPQLDQDGLIRVGGRIRDHPNMPWEMQCPVILPRHSYVTDLVIAREHKQNHMMGTNYLMGKVKEKYWILSARILSGRSSNGKDGTWQATTETLDMLIYMLIS
jgi:hypothetical protein